MTPKAAKPQSTEEKRASLIVPRADAEAQIQTQIDKGTELYERNIRSEADLEKAKSEFHIWRDYNKELLSRIVDTDELRRDYRTPLARVVLANAPHSVELKTFRSEIKRDKDRLESIKQRLKLIPESIEAPHAVEELVKPASTSAQSDEFAYDVFISYSNTDRNWVRKELLSILEQNGLQVCIDYRDFEVGAASAIEMERALLTSRKTILVLSPSYLESAWANFEAMMLQVLDPANSQRRLIPLLKEKCDLPLRIKYLTYVNFTDPDDMELSWRKLLKGLHGTPSSTSSPQSTQMPKPEIGPESPIQTVLFSYSLSEEENLILVLLNEGIVVKEIAYRTNHPESLIYMSIRNIYAKLGVRNRKEAVIKAKQMGLIPPKTTQTSLF